MVLASAITLPWPAAANVPRVGQIAAIRGDVFIHRDLAVSQSVLDESIFSRDEVETGDRSRARLKFNDDSLMTLSSNTIFSVQKYIEGKAEGKGDSIFRLLDGKLKAVSGRNHLEIHTPTAVAAARGTYFFVRVRKVNGAVMTDIACLSGSVLVVNIDPMVKGEVIVEAGHSATVSAGDPPTEPVPIPADLLKDVMNCSPASAAESTGVGE